MPAIYTTKQGETVDLVCLRYYGRTKDITETVLSANPGLSALGPMLPIGTSITMPDISTKSAAKDLVQLW